ncbi:MAG: glycosyltransferase family 39 protein [Candidatus Margulisiibacteriota bacterium]
MNNFMPLIQKSQRIQVYILLILAFALFTISIGNYPFIDGDATFYGQTAKNMIEHGDWTTLRFDHFDADYFVDKPPLTMWITALMFKLFGLTEFAGRFWHSLLAMFTVLITYLLGRRLFQHQIGMLAGFILTTSLQFFYQAREPLQDIPLAFCFALIFYLYVLFIQEKKFLYYYLLCLMIGIAIMIKGLVGLILPGAILLITFLFSKEYKNFKLKDYLAHLPGGLALVLMIALPWHIAEYLKEGSKFMEFYFGERTFSRYMGAQSFPGSAFPAYLIYLFLGFLPWAVFLAQSLYQGYKHYFKISSLPEKNYYLLLMVWITVTFIFFAVSPGNIFMRYLLPIFPACALLIAKYLYDNVTSPLIKPGIAAAFIGLLLSLITVIASTFSSQILNPATIHQDRIYLSILAPFLLFFSTGLLAAAYYLIKNKNKTAVYLLVILTSVSYFVFTGAVRKNIHLALPQKQIAALINQKINADTKVIKYMPHRGGLTMLSFYLKPYLKPVYNEKDLTEFLEGNPGTIIAVEDIDYIPAMLKSSLQLIHQQEKWGVYKKVTSNE